MGGSKKASKQQRLRAAPRQPGQSAPILQALLLTVGPGAGEVLGHVEGEEVYHSSLSPEEYAERLAELGLRVVEFVAEDPDCDFQTLLLAQKAKPQTTSASQR